LKVTVVWKKPHTWWGWLLVPPYIAICLAIVPLYLPGFLALGLALLYRWLDERSRAAVLEQPVDRLKLFAWWAPAVLLYALLAPLRWYGKQLTWVCSKLPFQEQPDPKEVS
jgi:hypothetical protein